MVWPVHEVRLSGGMPVSGSCGSGRGLNLRALGGGSIHKLPCALPGRRLTLRPLGANRRTAGPVVSGTYPTYSGGRWWAWISVVRAVCECSRADCMLHGFLHRWVLGDQLWRLPLAAWFSRTNLLGQLGCCRKMN